MSSLEIYTLEEIKDIADDLGTPKIEELKSILEEAGNDLLRRKKSVKVWTEKKQRKELNDVSKQLLKYSQKLRVLLQHSPGAIYDILDALERNQASRSLSVLRQGVQENFMLKKEFLYEVISLIGNACGEATNGNTLFFGRSTKTELVINWIWGFNEFWEDNSEITISEGRHEGGEQYVSPAMKILMKMAKPINCLLGKDEISNSQIAEAVKFYRKYPQERMTDEDYAMLAQEQIS